MIERKQAGIVTFCFFWTVNFDAVASSSNKVQALLNKCFLKLIKVMADRWHRNAQLMSEREQLDRLVMLKQSAESDDLPFICCIFEGSGTIEGLFETLQSFVIRFDFDAKSCYLVKQNAVCGQQRFNIAQLAMDRSCTRSNKSSNVRCGYFMLLLKQQLNNSTLPS